MSDFTYTIESTLKLATPDAQFFCVYSCLSVYFQWKFYVNTRRPKFWASLSRTLAFTGRYTSGKIQISPIMNSTYKLGVHWSGWKFNQLKILILTCNNAELSLIRDLELIVTYGDPHFKPQKCQLVVTINMDEKLTIGVCAHPEIHGTRTQIYWNKAVREKACRSLSEEVEMPRK